MFKSTKHKDESVEVYEVPLKSKSEKPNLDGDRLNLILLIILYTIQGFPIGVSTALPLILQSKKMVTYDDQASFSMALWPYSIKLLWAPIIDALYINSIGRRKSWLLPLQLLLGVTFFYMAFNMDNWLPETGRPNLTMIVRMVFVVNFLSATQDIVVDGWSLTVLKKKNVSYASVCPSIGVPIGMFSGSVCFTLLVSEEFSVKYFGTNLGTGGIMTMKSFFSIWAIIILMVTVFIGLFKSEKHKLEDNHKKISVFENYILLWDIIKLPRVRVLAVALLTIKMGFTASESVTNLKLIDAGIPKDDIMMITSVMYVMKFVFPIFVCKYVTSSTPMSYHLKITPIRLICGVLFSVLVYYTPSLIYKDGPIITIPLYYYLILGLVSLINEMLSLFLMLTLIAFFCKISDPRFGGTYMTLYNTFYFLGWLIPNTFVLRLIDILTLSECTNNVENTCYTKDLKNLCITNGGTCGIHVDGYYVAIAMCTAFGFIWLFTFRNILKNYQLVDAYHWMIHGKHLNNDEVNEPCIMSSA
ncbi:PREDICTED: acetyl-coenzyme A transporter 1-like [Diuraphis noxia]|uniref:acetyl-coenzyme A transporter 1-like n=1 Tax=Diuraphis noxia TaxID=143948 RepID=UPI0007639F01|nr:PREDICTED: acetyl-coenzyme A transporter 1-like [Diuraphis noxia]XP_015365765.1 PREDICTED: acetyl-coenzyme A transporter 1-like [Diuraphis noxia]XP_015365766.1 PREDICTED: acetyl-coenzyme A transporter 1-like [Diuraphis noxia]